MVMGCQLTGWRLFFGGGEGVALTVKQQAWIDYYKQGKTATEAARLAGYKAGNDNAFQSIGSENLRKLAPYIKDRDTLLERPRVADMQEINEFWTSIIRSDEEKTADRIKASELRAKAAGMFVDKLEHSGTVNTNPFAGLSTEELRRLAGEDG